MLKHALALVDQSATVDSHVQANCRARRAQKVRGAHAKARKSHTKCQVFVQTYNNKRRIVPSSCNTNVSHVNAWTALWQLRQHQHDKDVSGAMAGEGNIPLWKV